MCHKRVTLTVISRPVLEDHLYAVDILSFAREVVIVPAVLQQGNDTWMDKIIDPVSDL